MEETFNQIPHEIVMTNRNTLDVSGVTRVESFDSEEFLLQTDYGYLGIRGQGLHIKTLDLDQGRVSIEGQISDMSYLDMPVPAQEKVKSVWPDLQVTLQTQWFTMLLMLGSGFFSGSFLIFTGC